jgi:hypothetical protein
MKALITQVQVVDEADDLIATLDAFDEESFTIKWNNEILLPSELMFVAKLIESKQLYADMEV